MVALYTSETPLTRSSIWITSARVRSGGVPGGRESSICTNRSPPPGKSVTGIKYVSPMLPTVNTKAPTSVIALCRSVHLMIGVYTRCIHVSWTKVSSSSSPCPIGQVARPQQVCAQHRDGRQRDEQ